MPTESDLLRRSTQVGECRIWNGYIAKSGYGLIWADGKTRQVHRVAYEIYHGPIPAGYCVMHKCDTRSCIARAHLQAGTWSDNVNDMLRKGRGNKSHGDDHPWSKLTERDVAEIRRRYIHYDKINGRRALAKEFGVTTGTIWHLLNNRTWK